MAGDGAAEQVFDAASFLRSLPTRPGVYQMYDRMGDLLYVGKAKNLKNRVASYFSSQRPGSQDHGHGGKNQRYSGDRNPH